MTFDDPFMKVMAIHDIKDDLSSTEKMQVFMQGQNSTMDLFITKRNLEKIVDLQNENTSLKKRLVEMKKENDGLKKGAAIP